MIPFTTTHKDETDSIIEENKSLYEDGITTRLYTKLYSQAENRRSIDPTQQFFLKGTMIPNSTRKSFTRIAKDQFTNIEKAKRDSTVDSLSKTKCLLKEGSCRRGGEHRKVSIANVIKEKIITEQRGMDRLKKLVVPNLHDGLSESMLSSSSSSSRREIRRLSIIDEEMFKNAQKEITLSEVTMQVINGLRRPTMESLREAIHNSPKSQELVDLDNMEYGRKITSDSKNRDSFLKLIKSIENQREEANRRRLAGTKNSQTQTSFESYEFYIDIDVHPRTKKTYIK